MELDDWYRLWHCFSFYCLLCPFVCLFVSLSPSVRLRVTIRLEHQEISVSLTVVREISENRRKVREVSLEKSCLEKKLFITARGSDGSIVFSIVAKCFLC